MLGRKHVTIVLRQTQTKVWKYPLMIGIKWGFMRDPVSTKEPGYKLKWQKESTLLWD